MFASTKIKKPMAHAMTPAERRPVTHPWPETRSMKPATPPEYWVKVISAPIVAVRRMVIVRPRSANTPTRAFTEMINPSRGFQPAMMVHPSRIPTSRDT